MLGVMGFDARGRAAAPGAVPRSREARAAQSRVVTVAGVLAVVYMVVFTIYGYLRRVDTIAHLRALLVVRGPGVSARRRRAAQAAPPTGCQTCHRDQRGRVGGSGARFCTAPTCTATAASPASTATAAIPTPTDKAKAKAPATRGSAASRPDRWSIAVCARCHSDAELMRKSRAQTACGSGDRVRDQRAREAARQGRHQGGHLRQLPRRARHPAGQRRAVTGLRR